MPLEADQRAHRHVELAQLVGAAELRQVDDETGGEHLGADLAQQLHGALGSAAGRDQVVDQDHSVALLHGVDEMEVHEDAITKGERVIIVDDLIATGGTAEGAVKLLRQMGANVLAACFIIDLPELGGADKLRKLDVPVRTLLSFEGH